MSRKSYLTSARRIHTGDPDWAPNGAGLWFNHKYGAGLVDAAAAVALAGNWTNLGPQASTTFNFPSLPNSIPDGNATGTSRNINVTTANFRVEHVVLTTNLTHSNTGDLEITLTSPSGKQSILMQPRPFDSSADIVQWPFMSVHHWGESANGTWTAKIADRYTGNTGILNSLKLTLYGTANATTRAAAGNATLASETNTPTNNAADPGELVTVNLPLKNTGNATLGNLTATLLDTGTLSPITTSQSYGSLAPGATASQPFSFRTARAGSGTAANPILHLSNNGTHIGHAAFSLPLGTFSNASFNGGSITIRDNKTANPYPSTRTVSGLDGRVHRITTSLNSLSHSYLKDVGVLLNSPAGLQSILFDNATSTSVTNLNLTFDDLAPLFFPTGGSLPPGSYRPIYFYDPSGFTNLPDDEIGYSMGEFLGLNPNGTWRLYIEDFGAGDNGSLSSWTLNFRTNNCTDNLLFLDNTTSAPEGANATLTVWRTAGREGNASVGYSTLNGTALAGQDFTPITGTLTFLPGRNRQNSLHPPAHRSTPPRATRPSPSASPPPLATPRSAPLPSPTPPSPSPTSFPRPPSKLGPPPTASPATMPPPAPSSSPTASPTPKNSPSASIPPPSIRAAYQLNATTPGLPFTQLNGTATFTLEFLRRAGATYTPVKSPHPLPPRLVRLHRLPRHHPRRRHLGARPLRRAHRSRRHPRPVLHPSTSPSIEPPRRDGGTHRCCPTVPSKGISSCLASAGGLIPPSGQTESRSARQFPGHHPLERHPRGDLDPASVDADRRRSRASWWPLPRQRRSIAGASACSTTSSATAPSLWSRATS
ncbi:MAG: hypothetical protein HC901_04720 [Bdellovibrionaceae bacterium]|nr:hypothetical protein [Pseudobdellovibrionaceae bacterium]